MAACCNAESGCRSAEREHAAAQHLFATFLKMQFFLNFQFFVFFGFHVIRL